jgi:hypothetical protein
VKTSAYIITTTTSSRCCNCLHPPPACGANTMGSPVAMHSQLSLQRPLQQRRLLQVLRLQPAVPAAAPQLLPF